MCVILAGSAASTPEHLSARVRRKSLEAALLDVGRECLHLHRCAPPPPQHGSAGSLVGVSSRILKSLAATDSQLVNLLGVK